MKTWLASELSAITEPDAATRYALDFSRNRVTLLERRAGGYRERGRADPDSPHFEDEIVRLRQRISRRGRAAVDLFLPETLTLFRIETFPAESRANLYDEAFWRLDRLTPYRPQEVRYDVSLLSVEPNTGFLEVHIAIAPRDVVDEAMRYARDWGFAPQRVSARPPAEGFPLGPLFERGDEHPGEARGLRRAAVAMTAALALIAAIGLSRSVFERQALALEAETRRAEAAAALEAALETRRETLALAHAAIAPADFREERRFALDWLDAVAAALPPDAEATRIEFSLGRMRLEGVAANADAVLASLEVADGFERVRYAAPVNAVESGQGGPQTRQRFAIEAALIAAAEAER